MAYQLLTCKQKSPCIAVAIQGHKYKCGTTLIYSQAGPSTSLRLTLGSRIRLLPHGFANELMGDL